MFTYFKYTYVLESAADGRSRARMKGRGAEKGKLK